MPGDPKPDAAQRPAVSGDTLLMLVIAGSGTG